MNKYTIRGASWRNPRILARCAYRYWDLPRGWTLDLGFRVVREDTQKPHIIRGGSWYNSLRHACCAFRLTDSSSRKDNLMGFRIVKDARNE